MRIYIILSYNELKLHKDGWRRWMEELDEGSKYASCCSPCAETCANWSDKVSVIIWLYMCFCPI